MPLPHAIGQRKYVWEQKCNCYVGARHQQIIGKKENVYIAVPRSHAIGQRKYVWEQKSNCYVGARHQQIIGKKENVYIAVPRSHGKDEYINRDKIYEQQRKYLCIQH